MDSKLEKLQKILFEVLEKEDQGNIITKETKLISSDATDDIALSSIDYVEFLIDVEKQFNIIYNFDTVFETIGDLLQYIDGYEETQV